MQKIDNFKYTSSLTVEELINAKFKMNIITVLAPDS